MYGQSTFVCKFVIIIAWIPRGERLLNLLDDKSEERERII